ncbi:MAG: malectin domain-containing carbohydrate-binding protein, partial [Terracidiphilus sp.]
RPRTLWWPYAAAAVVLTLVVLAFLYTLSHARKAELNTSASVASSSTSTSSLSSASSAETPIRILAGYSGKPRIDGAGAVWRPDNYFHYGGNWNRPQDPVARTSDPMLFDHWRNGDFSYDIPLRPGVYELHLYFVTGEPPSNGAVTFTVSINYQRVLSGFDVYSDAMGANIADERIFRDVSPGSDGLLHLTFDSERGTASLSALEILSGTPHQQLPIRLVMQPESFTDHGGQFWHSDNYYMGGYTSEKRTEIAGTADPDVFAAERYGHFTYAIPVDTRDRYTLILHFAEFYFGPGASGVGGVGSRVFRVFCNGNMLLDDFDIYKEAGSLHALTKTFSHLKPTAQGKLNITFEPIVNNATVSGIEVLDESR